MKSKVTLFLIAVMIMAIFSGISWAADSKVLKLKKLQLQLWPRFLNPWLKVEPIMR